MYYNYIVFILCVLLANLSLVLKTKLNNKLLPWLLWAAVFIVFIIVTIQLEKFYYLSIYPKNWDFYTIIICMYVIFSYPSIVYNQMHRKKSSKKNN